jgi:hypothetical protein
MAEILNEPETGQPPFIPYLALAQQVFPDENKQKLMPFLGAGASLPRRPSFPFPARNFPSNDIDEISKKLGLQGRARLFMDLALRLAIEIQDQEKSSAASLDPRAVIARVEKSRFPPAADDLAELLANLSSYDTFERPRQKLRNLLSANDFDLAQVLRWIALLTDITQPTPPLLSVSSYYEYTMQRADLWGRLHRLFANYKWPSATNFLVARAAQWYLRPARGALKDYLIITTNYDCLMEVALDLFKVPYCVLTVGRHDRKVYGRLSKGAKEYLGYSDEDYKELENDLDGRFFPANFTLEKSRPLVVLYKIHGCLFPVRPNLDSIILSDEDYIDYLYHLSDNDGMIPSPVTKLMMGKGFLFVGYSFSDWNVRGIYKTLIEKRSSSASSRNTATGVPPVGGLQVQDYAVVRDLNVYESAFFRQKSISLLRTELHQFSRRVRLEARQWTRN